MGLPRRLYYSLLGFLLAVLLLARLSGAQVLPPTVPGSGGGGLPLTMCTPDVAVGLQPDGTLVCAPITPTMTPGLAPSGVDIAPTGEVTSTHLAAPLPFLQGGFGFNTGSPGGLPYFSSATGLASSPTFAINVPILGGGAGESPVPGSLSGTTRELASVLGTKVPGKQLTFDPDGNVIASATDIGAGVGGGGVVSVFGRFGVVTAQPGDYSAAQVSNAADVSAANVFSHPDGQTMLRIVLSGGLDGTVVLRAPLQAGSSAITFPAGVTDFSTTGGPGAVVRQSTGGGAFTVSPLAIADLAGGSAICTRLELCPGYQAALGFTPENVANKSPDTALGASDTFYPSQRAVKVYVDTALTGFQPALGFVPESLLNKSSSTTLGTSNLLYPTQNAVKTYVDVGLSGKQAVLGFTPEDVANKATTTALGTSNTAYPSQNAVKVYVDTAVAGKQTALGYTPEDAANKAASTALGTSNLLYPTQNAVKVYVDTIAATKQAVLGFTPEDAANKTPSTTLGTSNTLYPTQNAVKVYVDTLAATKQPTIIWGVGLTLNGATASVDSTEPGFLTNGGVLGLSCGVSAQGKMQVLSSGDLQYCDGATTSVLRSGTLTPSALHWNVTVANCTGDPNGGKLTVLANGDIVCVSDIGGGAGGGVSSVFGRTGAVSAQSGDYSAAQVTNAADRTATNTFTGVNTFSNVAGVSVAQLVMLGASSGSLTIKVPAAVGGANTLTLPAGGGDFTTTGSPGAVVRQSSLAGPLTVSPLAFSELTGTSGVCTTSSVCSGYQEVLTFGAGLSLAGATVHVDSTKTGFLTNGGAGPLGCGVGTSGKMQVLSTGELQYCDGASTPALQSGTLTPNALRWNVTVSSCTDDTNSGKLTVLANGAIICASDIGGGGGAVSSVFGRTGNVVATTGDYTAAQVTNVADVTAANVFTSASGQSMRQVLLPGATSGTLTVKAASVAGVSTLTLPGGTTDFSTSGGVSRVVRQSTVGGAFTVAQLDLSDLTGTSTLCTTASICTGYQAALGFSAENVANKSTTTTLGTSNTLYPTQNAVKVYVDTTLTGLQLALTAGAGISLTGTTIAVQSTKTGFLTNGGSTPLACGAGTAGQAQVLSTGELQYCDGAGTPVLHSGTLTPAALHWNVTISSCTGDANTGKLTVLANGDIVCASDIGGTGGGGAVNSVFGRTGNVVAATNDYTAAQVTNAADLTAANVFTSATGQSVRQLLLPGSTSGTLTVKAAAVAGTSTLTLPGGTTDFSSTGGTGRVVRQSSVGAALTVAQLDFTDLTGTSTVCTTASVCTGYQASLGFTAENVANKSTTITLGTSNTLYPTQNAVKVYVDTTVTGLQPALTAGNGLTLTGATLAVNSTEAGFFFNGGTTPLVCGVGAQGKAQVLSTGELQYCDGATTAVLQSGTLTPNALRWNVTIANCTGDINGGKLTVQASGTIVCASDIGGTTPVTSVFGRTGAVVATTGDYTAAQVTNAADRLAANTFTGVNTFTNAAGVSMPQLLLPGATSGTLTLKVAATAGTSTLTLPGGTTDLSVSGGASRVLRQSSVGAAITVSQLDFTDLTGTSTVCTTASVCAGYQATVTWGAGLSVTGTTASVASTEASFLTNGGATALTCGAGNAGKMQVMSSGDLQYCDGAATPNLRTGLPTQSGLTWNVAAGSCTGDIPNGGKLTVNASNQIICAADAGTPVPVSSVFGRTGAVVAATGDYTAAQVTNAADVTAVNTFTNSGGQSVRQLIMPGTTSGSLTLKAAATGTAVTLTFPSGTTDFSATGGTSQIVRQNAVGAAFTVGTLAFSELTGTANVCTTGSICTGYQAAITWGSGLQFSAGTASVLSTSNGFLVNGGATNLTCGAGTAGRMQVMSNGEHQYCDGAATPLLQAGRLTQTGLTWNVAAGTCTADGNAGKLTINGSNQIVCAADSGGAGDVTDVGTCTGGACFTDTTPGARLTWGPIVAPATPTAGRASVYVDSTSLNLAIKNASGVVMHGVQSVTAVASQFVTGINDDGSLTRATPTKADVGLGNVDNTSDATKNAATATLANKFVPPRVVPQTPVANVITPNADTTDIGTNYTLAAATQIANPTATAPNPRPHQKLTLEFRSTLPRALTWDTAYSGACGLALPTGTTGDGVTYNSFLFDYHDDSGVWCLIASTKGPANRITTLASSTTFTCPGDTSDVCQMQMTGASGTLTVAIPGGTPQDADLLMLRFMCSNQQTLAWATGTGGFLASPNIPLPPTCVAGVSAWFQVGFQYSTAHAKWEILGNN